MVNEFRSRWVISCGDGEINQETSAPVIDLSAFRLLISFAVKNNYLIETMDVKSAFLQSEIRTKKYMQQVTGYEHPLYPDFVCEMIKSSYGLPESAFNFILS